MGSRMSQDEILAWLRKNSPNVTWVDREVGKIDSQITSGEVIIIATRYAAANVIHHLVGGDWLLQVAFTDEESLTFAFTRLREHLQERVEKYQAF